MITDGVATHARGVASERSCARGLYRSDRSGSGGVLAIAGEQHSLAFRTIKGLPPQAEVGEVKRNASCPMGEENQGAEGLRHRHSFRRSPNAICDEFREVVDAYDSSDFEELGVQVVPAG